MASPLDSSAFDVPCNGCTLCCHGDAIRLLPEDDASQYRTVTHDHLKGTLMLDHKPNGDCIYLGERGCTIHAWKPLMCREMDCRTIAQRMTWTQARKFNVVKVWRKGKDMLAPTIDTNNAAPQETASRCGRSKLRQPSRHCSEGLKPNAPVAAAPLVRNKT